MQARIALLATTLFATPIVAQDAYWIANRTAGNVMQVSPLGEVLQTVPVSIAPRNAKVAPDGKVWVIGSSQVPVLNADGTLFASFTYGLGSTYDCAFDAAGNAWISGGTGVEAYDPAGNLLQSQPLAASAPLGITIDADGNKWICHRAGPPGSLSRIDGSTGAVSNHSMPTTSLILPTRCYADGRGAGNPSHIWVIGDNRGAGEVIELDAAGTVLNTYVLDPGGAFGSIVCDLDPATLTTANVYVGDFRNGNVWRLDMATGLAVPFGVAPDVLGLNFDGFGKLWATSRSTTQVLRIDAQGAIEAIGTVGAGVAAPLSTGWHHATTVDPMGDWDGDTVPNVFERLGQASPFNACSLPGHSLNVDGSSAYGGPTSLNILATGQAALAMTLTRSGTPLSLPGIGCAFELDVSTLVAAFGVGSGSQVLNLNIPNDPGLVGVSLLVQALDLGGAPTFTNVHGWLFY